MNAVGMVVNGALRELGRANLFLATVLAAVPAALVVAPVFIPFMGAFIALKDAPDRGWASPIVLGLLVSAAFGWFIRKRLKQLQQEELPVEAAVGACSERKE